MNTYTVIFIKEFKRKRNTVTITAHCELAAKDQVVIKYGYCKFLSCTKTL